MTYQKKFAQMMEIEWTKDDERLEAWCVENGIDPYNLAYRVHAVSQERWDRYVEDLKRYAASPKASTDLGAWLKHVAPPYDYKKNWAVMPNGKICVKD